MRQVNLLPKTEQRDLRLYFFSEQLVMFWIWVIGSLLLFLSLTYLANAYLDTQIAETESQIAQDKSVLKSSENEGLKEQVEGLNSQIASVKNINSQHYYWSNSLIELSNLLPEDIVLKSVTMNRIGGKVEIEGLAKKRESVLKFWANTKKSTYFKDIDFPLGNLDKAEDDPFTFSFFINQDEVKKP